MNAEDFDSLLERRCELMKKVLGSKAGEYASDKDRLHNFYATSSITRNTPAQALLGFQAKHLTAIIDAVTNETNVTRDWIDEKIGDAVNYLVLLEAVLVETQLYVSSEEDPF
jgi:hypothetical protein